MLTDATINAMLDNQFPSGAGNVLLSLHSAFSATGANLIGSKTSSNFSAASSRSKALSTAVDIAVPSANTVRWIGAWDSAGATFKGMFPNGGSDFSFQVGVTPNTIIAEGTGFANDDTITFHGGTPPAGLTEGTVYFVVGVTAGDPDTFQVAATQGGSAIDITGQPAAGCAVSKIIQDVYAGTGTHRVSTLAIAL